MRNLLVASLALPLVLSVSNPTAAFAATPLGGLCDEAAYGTGAQEITATSGECPITEEISKDETFQWKHRSKTVSYGPKLRYDVQYDRLCTADDLRVSNCRAFSEEVCPDGIRPISRSVLALNGPRKGQSLSNEVYCGSEPALAIPGASSDIAKVTPARFQRLPILASELNSQPTGFSLRNGFAHMYAAPEKQTFNIVVADQDVRVRAIPEAFVWSYGDGTGRTFKEPGAPVTEHSFSEETPTSHVYKKTGDFSVGLTTRFRGEYSTEGGPWIPIPGTANVPSDPMPMSVWRTKKLLVDQNCTEDPDGPACDSPFLKEKSTSK